MPTFVWEGKTRTGETKRGSIEADSEGTALSRLKGELREAEWRRCKVLVECVRKGSLQPSRLRALLGGHARRRAVAEMTGQTYWATALAEETVREAG